MYPQSDVFGNHGNHSGAGTLLSQHSRYLRSLRLSRFSCLLCKTLLFRCFFYCFFTPSLSFPFLFYPFSLLSYPIRFTFKIYFPTLLFTISFRFISLVNRLV